MPAMRPTSPPDGRTAMHGGRSAVFSAAGSWINRHAGFCLLALLCIGIGLRALLAAHCPISLGYVYDDCSQPVGYLVARHRLPPSDRYWQAYHPPLFFVVGAAFYRAGQLFSRPLVSLSLLSLLCGLTTALYSY